MKRSLKFLAMVAIATTVGTISKAQYTPQGQNRPVVKAIDSIQIAGVPVNAMGITITSLNDSLATVQTSLRYVGVGRLTSRGQISFSDTLQTTPDVGMSINIAAMRVAAKHGVTLK